MPFKWDAESERMLLLYIVKHCDVKPGTDAFNGVATALGEGVNANACKSVVEPHIFFLLLSSHPAFLLVFVHKELSLTVLTQSKVLQAEARV